MIPAPDVTSATAGKYLFFRMGREVYGIEILRVHEIASSGAVEAWPGQPDCGVGTIELRGRTLPVVDLWHRVPVEERAVPEDPVVVVVEMRRDGHVHQVGLLVDNLMEVRRLEAAQIMTSPPGDADETDMIAGMGRIDEGVACLLSPDRLLTATELKDLTCEMAVV